MPAIGSRRVGRHARLLAAAVASVAVVLVSASCGPSVDLKQALQISDVSTGWYDIGVVEQKNKIVPGASFRMKNVGQETLVSLQVNALFKRVGDSDEWASDFLNVTGSGGLAPGVQTDVLTVRSRLGYTGEEPRAQMLQNSHFVDARVEIFAKYGSAQWVKIDDQSVERRLILRQP